PSALAALDLILMMADGRAQAFGPKDEILKRVLRPAPAPVPVAAEPAAPQSAVPSIRESA
ncbi:type I secretion system permease/ATPase, partial [Methylorubrum sp. Q1]